ncbi:MAG: response regulator [Acidimicrobiales bacterium]
MSDQPVSSHSAGEARPIAVLLVEDHDMVREALGSALDARATIEVVGSAASVADARALLAGAETRVDVVVADLQLGDGQGTDLVEMAARRSPPASVLLITGTDDRRGLDLALRTGCAGFVSKAQGLDRLVDAVVAIAAGTAVFPAGLLAGVTRDGDAAVGATLTAREREVLQMLAEACSIDDIAAELVLSPHTARNHVKAILSKLHARSQLEAVVVGARHGLVEIG